MEANSHESRKNVFYIGELQRQVIDAKLKDPENIKRKRPMAPDDPRNIAPTIAQTSAPPLETMPQEHKSRFGARSKWAHLISEEPNLNMSDEDWEERTLQTIFESSVEKTIIDFRRTLVFFL